MAWTKVGEVVLTAQTTQVDFTSIPQTGKDLVLRTNAGGTSTNQHVDVYPNLSATSLATISWKEGNSDGNVSGSGVDEFIVYGPEDGSVGQRGFSELKWQNYALGNGYPAFYAISGAVQINNSNDDIHKISSGVYAVGNGTITSLRVRTLSGNFVVGSSFALYIAS